MNGNDFRKALVDATEYLAFYGKNMCSFSKPIEVKNHKGENKKVIPTLSYAEVVEEKKTIEIQELLNIAKSEMDYWNDHTESDECIFNQSDLWERRYKTLCEVMEIINR